MKARKTVVVVVVAVAAMSTIGACASGEDGGVSGASVPEPCDPAKHQMHCDGTVAVWCDDRDDPTHPVLAYYDCAEDGELCLPDKDGIGYCGQRCPADLAEYGSCGGTVHSWCSGELLVERDCSTLEEHVKCGVDERGEAFCTKPVPPDVDALGRCEGTLLLKRGGETFIEADCAEDGRQCLRDTVGEAYCVHQGDNYYCSRSCDVAESSPCPPAYHCTASAGESVGVCMLVQ